LWYLKEVLEKQKRKKREACSKETEASLIELLVAKAEKNGAINLIMIVSYYNAKE